MFAFHHRQTAFELGYPGNLFPARVFVSKVGSAAIFPDKGVHDVRVLPTILQMENAAALIVAEAKLDFVMTQKRPDDLVRIRRLGRRVHMDMVDWPRRPAVRGIGNKLRDLPFQGFRRQTAGRHHKHLLAVFRAGKMPRKGRAAGASCCPGDHFTNVPATRSR